MTSVYSGAFHAIAPLPLRSIISLKPGIAFKMEGSQPIANVRRKDTTKGPPLRILSLGMYPVQRLRLSTTRD